MITGAFTLKGASFEEAKQLAEDGDTAGAIAMLQQLEAEQPRNAEIPLLLGELYLATGNDADALAAYTSARKR